MTDRSKLLAEWRSCSGTEGRYEVSNYGDVRRRDGLLLTASVPRNSREYPCVMLRHSGERRRVAVHRLVALAFCGLPPFAGAQVRHLDGNHLNPTASNLAWGSAKDNADDRQGHGRTAHGPRPNRRGKATGSDNAAYRMTPEKMHVAKGMMERGHTQREIAAAVGVSQKTIWRIARAQAEALS